MTLCLLLPQAAARADFQGGLQAYQSGDYRRAYEEWIGLARDGDPAAMRNIGHLYRWGHGVQQDFAAAADWYRRAAELGLDRAQANLAMLYLEGQGVAEDPAQAAYWLSQAAIQGHTVAQFNLAQLYQQGRGVQRNEALALGWLQRAAKAGHPGALAQLSALVAEAPPPAPELQRHDAPPGTGAPPAPPALPPAETPVAAEIAADPPEENLEAPAADEAPELLDRLARVFGSREAAQEQQAPAPRPRVDAESGIALSRPAATAVPPALAPDSPGDLAGPQEGGRSAAEQWVLALVEDAITDEAAETEPAREAVPAAAPALAPAGAPAPQDPLPVPATAGSPVRVDAAAEMQQAMQAYDDGRYAEARQLFELLGRAGFPRAQYMLGWMNESGRGGAADLAIAYYWYMRASRGGDRESRRALADLEARIDPAVRARGETLLAQPEPPVGSGG